MPNSTHPPKDRKVEFEMLHCTIKTPFPFFRYTNEAFSKTAGASIRTGGGSDFSFVEWRGYCEVAQEFTASSVWR